MAALGIMARGIIPLAASTMLAGCGLGRRLGRHGAHGAAAWLYVHVGGIGCRSSTVHSPVNRQQHELAGGEHLHGSYGSRRGCWRGR